MTRPRAAKGDRGEEAIEAFQEAERIDARSRVQFGDDIIFRREAEEQRAKGQELLEPAREMAARVLCEGDRRRARPGSTNAQNASRSCRRVLDSAANQM